MKLTISRTLVLLTLLAANFRAIAQVASISREIDLRPFGWAPEPIQLPGVDRDWGTHRSIAFGPDGDLYVAYVLSDKKPLVRRGEMPLTLRLLRLSAEDGHVKWSHDLPTDSFQRYDLLSVQLGFISLIANDCLIRLTEDGTVTTIFDLSPYFWEAELDSTATSLMLYIHKPRLSGDLLFVDLATSNIIARCPNTSVSQTISKSSMIDYHLDKDDTLRSKPIYRSSFCGEPSPVGLTSDAWAGAYAIDGARYVVVGKGGIEIWEDGGHEITHLAFPRTKTALRWGQVSPNAKLATFTVIFGNFPEEPSEWTRDKVTAAAAYIISLDNAEKKATISLPLHACGFPEYAFSQDGTKLALLCDGSWDLKVFALSGFQQ